MFAASTRQPRARMPRVVDRRRAGGLHAVHRDARVAARAPRRARRPPASRRRPRRRSRRDRELARRSRRRACRRRRSRGDRSSSARGRARARATSRLRDLGGLVVVAAGLDELGTEAAHRGVLLGVVAVRHADHDRHAELRAGPREARAVVAARRRDDAARALRGVSAVMNDIALRALNAFVGRWFSCFTSTRIPPPTSASSVAIVAQRRRREVRRDSRAALRGCRPT